MRSHALVSKAKIAGLVAAGALIGGLAAGGALELAQGGGEVSGNTFYICISPSDRALYANNSGSCEEDFTRVGVKTELALADATALEQKQLALKAAAAKYERKLDAANLPNNIENQLRLQGYLERSAKASQQVSNALKKMNQTASSIIQNLK